MKGERGKPIYWCMPIELTLLFPLFPFFSSLFSFLSFFFSSYFVFFFSLPKILYFSIPFPGHGKGPFIVPAVTKVLPFCPLTVFVWSGCTCRPLEVCATHSCQTEACFSSPPYRSTSFLSRYKCFLSLLSRHAPNGSPSNLPLLGGLSSQQDVPPKRA